MTDAKTTLVTEVDKNDIIIALVRRIVGKSGGTLLLTQKEMDAKEQYLVRLYATREHLCFELVRKQ